MKKISISKLIMLFIFINICNQSESIYSGTSESKINDCIALADAIEEVFDEIQIQAYESSIYRSYSNIDPTKLDYVYEALRINKIGIDGIENIRDKYIINRTFFDNLLTGFYNNFEDSRTANLAMEEHLLSINNQWTIQDEVDWWEENQEYSIRNWRTSDEFKELMLTKSQNTLNPDPDFVVSDSYPKKVLRKYCDSL